MPTTSPSFAKTSRTGFTMPLPAFLATDTITTLNLMIKLSPLRRYPLLIDLHTQEDSIGAKISKHLSPT